MPKIDLKKEFKHLYNPSAKKQTIVEVPAMSFLMINGKGDPNTSLEYQQALETLYAMSYTLKFMLKKSVEAIDYVVMPLEGLWWTEDMAEFSIARKDEWQWTAMIMQPEFVNEHHVRQATEEVRKKKNPAALDKIRFENFEEGLSAQILYFGPYADEAPTIARLHQFIHDNGYELSGKHHEVYLNDPRRTAPEKLKTVIRQPMRKI